MDWQLFRFNLRIMQHGAFRAPVVLGVIIFMMMFANYRLKPDALDHFMASLLLIIPAFLLVQDFQNYLQEDIRNGFLERYLSQSDALSYIGVKFLSYIVRVILPFAAVSGIYALFESGMMGCAIITSCVFLMGLGFVSMGINFCILRNAPSMGLIGYALIPLQIPSYLLLISAIERQSILNNEFMMAVGMIIITTGLSLLLFQRVVRELF